MPDQWYVRLAMLKGKQGVTREQMQEAGAIGSTHVPSGGQQSPRAKRFFGFQDPGTGRVYGLSITVWDSDDNRRRGHNRLRQDWDNLKATLIDAVTVNDFEIPDPS